MGLARLADDTAADDPNLSPNTFIFGGNHGNEKDHYFRYHSQGRRAGTWGQIKRQPEAGNCQTARKALYFFTNWLHELRAGFLLLKLVADNLGKTFFYFIC